MAWNHWDWLGGWMIALIVARKVHNVLSSKFEQIGPPEDQALESLHVQITQISYSSRNSRSAASSRHP